MTRTASLAAMCWLVAAGSAQGQTGPIERLPPVREDVILTPAGGEEDPPEAGEGEEAAPAGEALPEGEEAEGEALEAEEVDAVEVEPEPEVVWYEPRYWIGPVWEGDLEFGLNGSAGNSEALSFRTGAKLKRETKRHKLAVDITHARTKTNGVETQNNALGNARWDRLFEDSPWSLFMKGMLEYDEFKAFDVRLVGNLGVGYAFVKSDITTLAGRFGSGVSHEIGGPDDEVVPEAVFGMDFERKLSKKQQLSVKVDYFPEWGDFDNYRLVTDAGWEVLLDAATNLSLKVGVIDRYDSTPNGLKHNDVDYSLLFLWKL